MFKRKKDPLRTAIQALYRIRTLRQKIDVLVNRLRDRREMLFQKLMEYEARGDKYLAKAYAAEISNLDKLTARLDAVLLLLDKIDLAMQFAIHMRDFREISGEILDVVKKISSLPEISGIPELNFEMIQLEGAVRDLASSEYVPDLQVSYTASFDSEARKVLEEAKEIAKKKLELEA